MNPTELYRCENELSPVERLSYRPGDAAKALGISLSHLDRLTKAGEIPCVRLGSLRTYPVDVVREWLASKARASQEGRHDAS